MKLAKTVDLINNSYRNLNERTVQFTEMLTKLGHKVEWGYYNSHSVTVNGETYLEYYPIPVITVNDTCNVGIDFSNVFIEGKLYKDETGNFDIEKFRDYKLTVCGTENYLSDIYSDGMDNDEFAGSVEESGEEEIIIRIELDGEPLIKEILEVIKLLDETGTHIKSRSTDDNIPEGMHSLSEMDENTPAFEVAKVLMDE